MNTSPRNHLGKGSCMRRKSNKGHSMVILQRALVEFKSITLVSRGRDSQSSNKTTTSRTWKLVVASSCSAIEAASLEVAATQHHLDLSKRAVRRSSNSRALFTHLWETIKWLTSNLARWCRTHSELALLGISWITTPHKRWVLVSQVDQELLMLVEAELAASETDKLTMVPHASLQDSNKMTALLIGNNQCSWQEGLRHR